MIRSALLGIGAGLPTDWPDLTALVAEIETLEASRAVAPRSGRVSESAA